MNKLGDGKHYPNGLSPTYYFMGLLMCIRHSLNAGPYLLLKVEKVVGKRKRKQTVDLRRTVLEVSNSVNLNLNLKLKLCLIATAGERTCRVSQTRRRTRSPPTRPLTSTSKSRARFLFLSLGFRFLFLQNL